MEYLQRGGGTLRLLCALFSEFQIRFRLFRNVSCRTNSSKLIQTKSIVQCRVTVINNKPQRYNSTLRVAKTSLDKDPTLKNRSGSWQHSSCKKVRILQKCPLSAKDQDPAKRSAVCKKDQDPARKVRCLQKISILQQGPLSAKMFGSYTKGPDPSKMSV